MNAIDKVLTMVQGADAVGEFSIEMALSRNWSTNNKRISVSVHAHNVMLTGTADTEYQKKEAGRIALTDPHSWSLDNELLVPGHPGK
ncbi:MAG: BON domain-containing protein [Bacteroidota bacterium]